MGAAIAAVEFEKWHQSISMGCQPVLAKTWRFVINDVSEISAALRITSLKMVAESWHTQLSVIKPFLP